MGSYCGTSAECRITLGKNVSCRKSICQCDIGYKVDEDEYDCVVDSSAEKAKLNIFIVAFLICSALKMAL